ncbi:MAG TPA: DUF1501 domain-containing protein [Anaerolineae bacterium]|nr:DUF1501 domain-containing protein [Anaerolineae bacterium]
MKGRKLSRREFLQVSGGGLAAWGLMGLPGGLRLTLTPAAEPPDHDVLICIFLRGGMDGLNAVIPLFDADYFRQRPTLAVPEDEALDLDGRFGLHPALRPLQDAWEAGHLALIHAVGSPDPTHSHFDAQDFMERGAPGDKSVSSGWIARHLSSAPWQNDSPFRAVGLGGVRPASLRGPVPVTTLHALDDFRLQGRVADKGTLQDTLAALYTQDEALAEAAQATFDVIETLAGVDLADDAAYPESDFGQNLLQAARLIKAGVGLEAAAVDLGGFDTHVNQGVVEGALARLLAELAEGLAAFYRDLGDQIDRVAIVAMSEFGRRAYENGNKGTDHGHGGVMFALGGGVRGGQVYAEWPGLGEGDLYGPGDLAVTTDFRDVLGELVQKRLGNANLETVFPGYTVQPRGVFQTA